MKKLILTGLLLITPFIVSSQENRVSINDFSGALNTKMSANQLPINQCSAAKDVLFDEKPGSIVTRGGYSLVTSTSARELFEYKKSNGQQYLIKHYQGRMHATLNDGNDWIEIATDLNWQLNRVRATVFEDLFIYTTGVNDVGIYDGDANTTHDFIPKGLLITSDKNRVFIGNTWANPDRVYYNVLGEDIETEEAWPARNYISIGSQNGDIVTAFASFRDQLIIFTEFSTWALLGNDPDTWQLIKINSNYGCLNQENIDIDKGLLKFVSHVGIKAYNGSQIIDIDFPIEDKILDSNNITGEYNYLQYAKTSNFIVESSTNIDTQLNSLKLEEQEVEWEGSDLNYTLSNIAYKNSELKLSTTTNRTLTTYTATSDLGDWNVYNLDQTTALNKGYVGRWKIDDVDGSGNANTESYSNVNSDYQALYTKQPYNLSNSFQSSIKLDSVRFRGDISYRAFAHVVGQHESSRARKARSLSKTSLNSNAVVIKVYAQLVLILTNGTRHEYGAKKEALSIGTPSLTGTTVADDAKGSGRRVYVEWIAENKGVVYQDMSWSNIVVPNNYSVDEVEIYFTTTGQSFTNINYFTVPTQDGYLYSANVEAIDSYSWDYGFSVPKIYDIELKHRESNQVFESTGTFSLPVKTIDSFQSSFSSVTINRDSGDLYDYENNGSSATLQFSVSMDSITWGNWMELDIDTYTWIGVLPSTTAKYIKCKGAFSTTDTSQTPYLTSILINLVNSSGTIVLQSENIAKVEGGYSNFIAEGIISGQTANYFIRLSTGSTALRETSYTQITNGQNIQTLLSPTTNQTWIQYKVYLQSYNGTSPQIFSLTSIYIPVAAPVDALSKSIGDRWHLAISTSGDTNNSTILVHDKNNAWTLFEITVDGWTKYGRDTLFSNSGGIYKMYDGTTDAGTAITSSWEKVFPFDYSFDSHLNHIYTIGQKQSDGALDIIYKIENSTTEYSASNIDLGSSGRFRSLQSNAFNVSPVADWTIILQSTSPFEVNTLELWPEVLPEHNQQ